MSLFIDGLAFIFYYTMWTFVLSSRYQEGKLFLYDKITLGIASFSMLTALMSPYISITGINYVIAAYSLHMLSFAIFGLMVVGKLIYKSNKARKIDSQYKAEEKLLLITGWGFVASFLFFILTLALLPIDSMFGLFMIPKTLAYMVSFGAIIKLLYSKN